MTEHGSVIVVGAFLRRGTDWTLEGWPFHLALSLLNELIETHLHVDNGLDAEPLELRDGFGDVGTVGARHGQQVVRHPVAAGRRRTLKASLVTYQSFIGHDCE